MDRIGKNSSSFALTLALTCGAVLPAAAQEDLVGLRRVGVSGTPEFHTLDVDTGVLRPSSAATVAFLSGGSTSEPCYANTVDGDLVADALLFPPTDEIFDWGIKSCGGSSFVDRVTIGYASQAVSTNFGGPGGRLELRVYRGARGGGDFGDEVLVLDLAGLPSSGSIGLDPKYLTLELGSKSFFLPDGPIGWSYENPDGKTAPLLVDVVDEHGTENAIDVYRPGPAKVSSYLGTFTFPAGGFSNDPLENSFYIQLHQNETASAVQTVESPANPTVFVAERGPVVGSPWVARVLGQPETAVTFVVFSLRPIRGAPTMNGQALIDPKARFGTLSIRTGGEHEVPIPLDPSVIGLRVHAQAGFSVSTRAEYRLTNALELTVGAH